MTSKKGFTLIELAVVIAIIAILAAVALPRFADTTSQAEASIIKDLKAQLISAAAMYTAANAAAPTAFQDFVATTRVAAAPRTIGLGGVGNGGCTVGSGAAGIITCDSAFTRWATVRYAWNNGGVVVTATPAAGNTLAAINQ